MNIEPLDLLRQKASADYIGEPVSQLAHALQAAALAREAGAGENLVLAALLHDIGHLCRPDAPQMEGLGVIDHEKLGARYLEQQGLPVSVTRPVQLHVDAKRFLASKPAYETKLSDASRQTLAFQGGPMTETEAARFERDPLFKSALQLRAWDDAAKVADLVVPPLAAYEAMFRRHRSIPETDIRQWRDCGFLHIPGWYSPDEMKDLDASTGQLQALPETPGKWMKYFETVAGERRLCRVENFLQYEPAFDEVARGSAMMHLLQSLLGEPAVIFKEKINFKLPGGQGFAPHQDAPAFASFDQTYHLTVMLSIDASTIENGCLEIVDSSAFRSTLPLNDDLTLTDEFTRSHDWRPIETGPGDLLIFDAFLPHRSGVNQTGSPRRALYATYNLAAEGSFRDDYFRIKRETFPPDVERIPGKQYESGVFNVGNPVD